MVLHLVTKKKRIKKLMDAVHLQCNFLFGDTPKPKGEQETDSDKSWSAYLTDEIVDISL